jgi:hypothetical protein
MNFKSRLSRLEDAADRGLPEVVSYKAMLDRAWAIKAKLRGWSDRELKEHRKAHEAAVAQARDAASRTNWPPNDGTYKATLERAKAISAELRKQHNDEDTA